MKICENRIISRLSLGIAFVLGSAISAEAANLAAFNVGTPTPPNPSQGIDIQTTDFTAGIRLQVLETIQMTGIGVLTGGFDGPQIAPGGRTVTLWRESNQSPVFSTLITNTTANTFESGGFRYLNLTATNQIQTLDPGFYRLSTFIAPDVQGDYNYFNTSNLTFNDSSKIVASPILNIVQLNGANGYPSQGFVPTNGNYRITSNLLFDDGTGGGGNPTVPEPTMIGGLLLFGLVGLLQKRQN